MAELYRCTNCGGSGVEPLTGATLIPAILFDYGADYFTTANLKAHARLIDGPLRPLLQVYTAKRLGKLLRSLEGQRVDELVLERCGHERNRVALWRIVSV